MPANHHWEDLPELGAVHVFTTVAELKSFRAASAALGLPRSTVSRRLATLEAALKTRLIHRTTRHVSLTDAGAAFLKQVTPALQMIRDAGRGVLDAHAEPRGLVRITGTPGGGERIAQVVLGLLERHPGMRVELELTDRHVDLVAEGFDVAVRTGALADSSLVVRPLGVSASGYWASPAYLQRTKAPRAPEDLAKHDCIVFSGRSRAGRWEFLRGRKRLDVTVNGPLSTNQLAVAKLAAVQGRGITWLPEPYAADDIARGRLVPVLRRFWPAPVPMQLLYPSARNLAPQVRVTVDALARALSH